MKRRRPYRHLALLLATIASPPTSIAAECPPARIQVVSSYHAPRGFDYAAREELRTTARTKDEPLGIIETTVGWAAEVTIQRRCLGAECQLCVSRIEGEAGFGPGRMLVTATLRGDQCRTHAVLAHEAKHSRVFEESTRLGVERLVDMLKRWAGQQTARAAMREEVEAAAKARYDEIVWMLQEGVAWIEERARVRNRRIDSPQAYEAELDSMERRCRKSR